MNGRPRLIDLVVDTVSRLRRPLVPTAVALLIVFAGSTALFATTGLALASQQRTLDRLNSPEGRLITITDPQGSAGLSAASVSAVATLTGVEWTAGVGPAVDVSNSAVPGGKTVVARALYGQLPPNIAASTQPTDGQALAGPGLTATLGLGDGVGAVSGGTTKAVVVGTFVASAPLSHLNANVLIHAPLDDASRLLTLWVSVDDIAQLPLVTAAVRSTLIARSPGALRVDTAVGVATLSNDVIDEMARTAQLTLTGLLVAVAVLIGAVQFGRVAGMAKDIGRRRALGASRTTIVIQVLLNATVCALLGATGGGVAGLILTKALTGAFPPAAFILGIGVLMLLAALAGSLLPAIKAARLDPVRILRVP